MSTRPRRTQRTPQSVHDITRRLREQYLHSLLFGGPTQYEIVRNAGAQPQELRPIREAAG